ncbi:MAG: autotransporter-associated beta strand repeat-containing protein, partial [Verrucomicrobiales bacterium]|nr:autotransporter-associated beta strand repeat-containing protein [Verrucomicrobiales bacterium]
GTLAIKAANAVGTGTITINGGAGTGLEVRGGAGITLTNAITNSTTDGGLNIASGTNILSGVVTATSQLRFNVEPGASANLSNATTALVGAGTILKSGGGTLILSGVNTATGAMVVRNGSLELNYTTNNTSKLADAASLTLGGIGALTVPGADGTNASQTKIDGQKGGTVNLVGGSHVEVVSATTIDTGSNAVIRTSGTGVLRMNAITRGVNQGTIDFGAASIADTDTNNVNGILGGYATVAKTDWATSVASGAADTPITALGAYAVDAYASGNNTDVTLAAANTGLATLTNSLRFNASQATTLTIGAAMGVQGTAVGLQSGGILVTPSVGAFATIISGAPLQNAASTVNLETIIHQHNTAGFLEIDSVIQNNTLATAQGLTKTGAGKVILNGLNTFSGVVNLYEGEIQVGGTAAAPTVATNSYLSGVAVGTGNASTAWNLGIGSTLRFLTTNTTVYNTPAITGDGNLILDAGNQGVLLFDDNNDNFYGDITFSGGTIRMANQAQALGNVRGNMTVSNSVNFIFNSAVTSNKPIIYNDGATFNVLSNTTTSTGTFSGKQTFNNAAASGLVFNVPAPTTDGIVGLNISGIIYGTNGFTKAGPGILQISANNFSDVYDGYTGINKTPTFSGQIQVNEGTLYVGGTRALGAFGIGNETIAANGASIDMRGAATNLGDDSSSTREIFKIQGTGFVNANGNATGALRNSTGTGAVSFLVLDGDASINGGGQSNNSVIQIATFDTNLSNANTLANAFTRNQPVIAGNNRDLTILGSRNGTDNVTMLDPSFSSALSKMLVREGTLRVTKETNVPTSFAGLMAADFTNGIEIGYGGQTAADLTGSITGDAGNSSVLGPIVGAKLYLLNQYGLHNTV